MNKTEQAQQLRLAAEIIETGHPWEYWHIADQEWLKPEQDSTPQCYLRNPTYKIRLALAAPPDGRPLHNPDGLTAEQVGAGWRLLAVGEKLPEGYDFWHRDEWDKGYFPGKRVPEYESDSPCRVPLSVPWLEAPKPDPTTKTVLLGPEDVLPGSVFRMNHFDSGVWILPCATASNGISYANPDRECEELTWSQLNGDFQINRSIPLTGKWDANAWEPCSKEVSA